MTRLIDADALKKNSDITVRGTTIGKREYVMHHEIDNAPTIDAVQVVRCKDCLLTKERDEYTNKIWCCRHREYMDDMYYCADGLRREDGEEE